jgi:hypothetical protein
MILPLSADSGGCPNIQIIIVLSNVQKLLTGLSSQYPVNSFFIQCSTLDTVSLNIVQRGREL